MAEKATKKERIEARVEAGVDHITAEMEVIQEDTDKALRKLKVKQEREQKKIDEATVDIIRKDYPDVWKEAQARARKDAEERRTKRANAASKSHSDGAHAAEPEAPTEQNTSPDEQQNAPGGEHSGAHYGH